MTKRIPNYLRIHTEDTRPTEGQAIDGLSALAEVCQAFERATGWTLRYAPGAPPAGDPDLLWSAPVDPGVGKAPGHLRIDRRGVQTPTSADCVDLATAGQLAGAVGAILAQLSAAQTAVWQREAELAAGVPVAVRDDEPALLAARLEAVLRSGAEAIGGHAAALYMLDVDTTVLKLRSSWALGAERLVEPARALRGAMADLEALLGHAVVLQNPSMMRYWRAPEPFCSAVCVPVSTSTTPLGTLWVYSREERDFSDHQTGLVEIIAGRIASELQCEMLLSDRAENAWIRRQVAAAARLQDEQLPRVVPLMEGWDLAGWTRRAHPIGGDFYDWFVAADERLIIAAGAFDDPGLDTALAAAALRGALRAHAHYEHDLAVLLERAGRTLWSSCTGEHPASLFVAATSGGSGRLRYALAGRFGALVLRGEKWELLSAPTPLLGTEPKVSADERQCTLSPGEFLVVYSDTVRNALDADGRPWSDCGMAQPLLGHAGASASALADLARAMLDTRSSSALTNDETLLVVKRRA